jgi:hypothetical protein
MGYLSDVTHAEGSIFFLSWIKCLLIIGAAGLSAKEFVVLIV